MLECCRDLNKRLVFAAFAISFGSSFQQPFHMVVINLDGDNFRKWTTESYRQRQHGKTLLDVTYISWFITAAYPLGGTLGTLCSYYLSSCIGRKWTLVASNVVVLTATLLLCFSSVHFSWEMFLGGKLLIGFVSGVTIPLGLVYLIEIAPETLRGAIGMSYAVVVAFSVVCALLAGQALGEEYDKWPFIFTIPAIPAIIQIFTLPFCPESPRYLLISRGKVEKAYKALSWLRNADDELVEKEFAELVDEKEILIRIQPKVRFKDILMNIELRTPWVICVVAMIGQQCCGILVIITHSTDIFSRGGMSKAQANLGTLCMTIIFLLVTVLVMCIVEFAGRRLLILISYFGMAVSTTLLSISLSISKHHNNSWINVLCIILFVLYEIFYSIGTGGVTWLLLPELFPHTGRMLAVSTAVPFNLISGFLVILFYRVSEPYIKSYTFLIIVGFDFIIFFFFYVYLPETMDKTSKDMIYMFRQEPTNFSSEEANKKG